MTKTPTDNAEGFDFRQVDEIRNRQTISAADTEENTTRPKQESLSASHIAEEVGDTREDQTCKDTIHLADRDAAETVPPPNRGNRTCPAGHTVVADRPRVHTQPKSSLNLFKKNIIIAVVRATT